MAQPEKVCFVVLLQFNHLVRAHMKAIVSVRALNRMWLQRVQEANGSMQYIQHLTAAFLVS